MILVTGAAGKTGRAIIEALSARGGAARAWVHRGEQIQILKSLGAEEVILGDMRDPKTMDQAVRGVRSVYHICPNVSPDEISMGRIAIEAARSTGVKHFVYHSVLHPQTEAMPHHWQKLRVEEMLFESKMAYTILQPAAYMQNVLSYWEQITREGIYAVPYVVDTRLGLVDLEDVAEVAAKVLMELGHEGATYELCGTEVLSPIEVASILSTQLGQEVCAEHVPLDVWEEGARAAGLGEYQRETLVKMFQYYECYGFWGNPRVLGWLLGREPKSFTDFVARAIEEQR
jgi:NAD(P)H dehydrogenase (quinone)